MKSRWINLSSERDTLLQTANLLERLREEVGSDPRLDDLIAGLNAMYRLTLGGCPIHRAALEELTETLAKIGHPRSPLGVTIQGRRRNAIAEASQLLRRLDRGALHRSVVKH